MKNNRTFLEKLLDGAEVEWKPLNKIVTTITAPVKLKREMYCSTGSTPIIDQGEKFIAGYTDENFEAIPSNEYIIFGDHSEHIKYVNFSFIQGADGLKILKPKEDNAKYIYYAFQNFYVKELNYKRHWSSAKETLIPLPPPAVQTEIVKILDALTALTSELTSELILRRKQYEYYREKLLSHNDSENSSQQKVDKDKLFSTSNIQWLHLNEIYKFQYGIGNKIPTIGGEYPVYGSNGIVGSHNEYNSEDAPVIGHIGAYAGIVNWAEGKHFVTYNGIICNKINDNVNSRYAYYLLLSQNFIDKANKASQPFISYDILNKCIVPVPPIGEQQRIVSILDKFEILTNSITEGLPLAIEQSQKRYEYYRELLLNFPGRE